jgi:uncharacterized protein (DUF1501 family)
MNRRSFLQAGASGLGALWLADLAGERRAAAEEAKRPARADACIVLWLNGGPSHVDTFDPKPGTKGGGPFRAIATRAAGVKFAEHLPRLAEQAHRLAVVRGMTSLEGNHQRARFLAHTGYSPNPTVEHPALGAWVSARRADAHADLPAFVAVGGPSAGGGFLGVQRGPFIVPDAGAPPANVHPARRVDAPRLDDRRAALGFLEARFAAETDDPKVAARRAVYEEAAALMRSPHLGAFDLASEPEKTRQGYGDSDFGRGCLLARRLVEAGVKYVEVQLDGWDTHKDNFTRVQRKLGELDPAAAALLADLEARRLLDRTLVVVMGEFGRTPAINPDEGRDHHPKAWSVLLAGGGVRGGVVHGKTDAAGESVVEGATRVPDLFATMATQLGLDPDETVQTRVGRPIAVTDGGTPIRAVLL